MVACVVSWQAMQFWRRSWYVLDIVYPQNRNYDKRNNKCPINHRQWYQSWIFKVKISLWITREIAPSNHVLHMHYFSQIISVFSWFRVTRSLVLFYVLFCFLFTNIISWLYLCAYFIFRRLFYSNILKQNVVYCRCKNCFCELNVMCKEHIILH